MQPWTLLRIAAGLSLFYCLGHSSGFPWMAPDGPENTALVERLQAHRFEMMGASRTVWDFHVGFGLVLSLDLLVQAALLWFLAAATKRDAASVRPMIGIIALGFAGNAAFVARYFFVIPLVTALAIALCVAVAFVQTRPSRSASRTLAPSR